LAGAIVVGLVDVDAVTVSMLRLTLDTLSQAHAVAAILAAVASDTVRRSALQSAAAGSRLTSRSWPWVASQREAQRRG